MIRKYADKKFIFIHMIMFAIVCSILFMGCSNLKENQTRGVEEPETEGNITASVSNSQKETEVLETLNGVDKEMVAAYIDDSHFYDEKDGVDFVYSINDKKYHITILDAWCTDNLAECGEYFINNPSDIPEMRKYITELHGIKDENISYLCLKIQLTNKENTETEFCIKNFMPLVRTADDRLTEYGLADAYIDLPLIYSELWYDYSEKKSGKSSYFFDIQPEETTEAMTVVYLVEKGKISGNWYLGLNLGKPKYNSKFRCNFPPDDENVKFLKINLRGVNKE